MMGGLQRLDLDGVAVRFGRVQALAGVDVGMRAGEALLLAGPNGAGKSTLLGVLLGLVRPDAGALRVDGRPHPVDQSLRAAIGYLPEAVAFSESLTGRQVARFFANARGVPHRKVDAMLAEVGLAAAARRPVRGYSRGMRQRLGLGLATLHEPELLILDEPTGGLDQEGLALLWRVIGRWRAAGRMVLLSSHDLTLLERRVDRICVMRAGRVLATDTPDGLRAMAGLPVRVRLQGDAAALGQLAAEVAGRPGLLDCEPRDDRLHMTVRPDGLLAVLATVTAHGPDIATMRVEEPGLDDVYEHLLATADCRQDDSLLAATGGSATIETATLHPGAWGGFASMGRVGLALIWHELVERTRDRWVLIISALFALLAAGTTLYGRSAEGSAQALIGPSLVTLISLLVPLVGAVLGHDAIVGERERNTLGLLLSLPASRFEIVVAKFIGRLLALSCAVGIGLGAAMLLAGAEQAAVLAQLVWPTLLLGAAFLAVGVLISTVSSRQVTAASLVVTTWFLFVFFYDLGLLALLVASDGAISQDTIAQLVFANPAGLFRVEMMGRFAGPEVLESLGMTVALPGRAASAAIWCAWVAGPVLLSALALARRKVGR